MRSLGLLLLCRAFDDHVRDTYRSNRLIQAACTAHALQNTTNTVACGRAVDECLDMLPPAVESALAMILAQASCEAAGTTPTGCASPVSALAGCLDALGTQLDRIQLSLTCAAFGSPVPPGWWRITPPSCTALATDC